MDQNEYIKKWVAGTLSEEEKELFEQTEEYQHLEKLSDSLLAFKAPEYDVETALLQLKEKVPQTNAMNVSWRKPLFWAAAAVFVGVIGVYFYFLTNSVTVIETQAAETTEVILPDSSLVVLNALSRISYDKDDWESERQIKLEGEAFFKVRPGSTFSVISAPGVVTVLGTEFNVKNRKDLFEVICYEGLVKVQTLHKSEKLSAGHLFRIVNDELKKDTAVEEKTPDWLLNQSSFESVPFIHVVEEFERQYNVSVELKDVDVNQLFSGKFSHSDISVALKSISYPLNLDYQITDRKVILIGAGK